MSNADHLEEDKSHFSIFPHAIEGRLAAHLLTKDNSLYRNISRIIIAVIRRALIDNPRLSWQNIKLNSSSKQHRLQRTGLIRTVQALTYNWKSFNGFFLIFLVCMHCCAQHATILQKNQTNLTHFDSLLKFTKRRRLVTYVK